MIIVSAQYLAAVAHNGEACGSLFKEAHFYLYNASAMPQTCHTDGRQVPSPVGFRQAEIDPATRLP